MGLYASDGLCHNAELGTFGHECGKPAEWIGTDANGFRSGFCLACRAQGAEARRMVRWEPLPLDVAIAAAEAADKAFGVELQAAGFASRWAWNGRGGTAALRAAYDRKVSADKAMSLAFDRDRARR